MIPCMGVDPGVRGGMAVLDEAGHVAYTFPLNPTMTRNELADVTNTGALWLRRAGGKVAYHEQVSYIRGDGGQGAFTFGRVSALLEMALHYNALEIRMVPPMVWQSRLGCLTGGDKNVSKRMAMTLFPNAPVKITHAIADALLIARYGQLALGAGG